MQLTGYFVEYLIIGSFSLVWLLPLLYKVQVPLPKDKVIIALLAPSLYVIGMIIDVVGHFLTLPHRRRIRDHAKARYTGRYGIARIEHATVEAELLAGVPDLAKAAAAKTSRSRVARGTLTNTICAIPVWLAAAWPMLSGLGIGLLAGAGLLSVVALWGAWARWQRIAYRFEIKALSMIEQAVGPEAAA